MRWAQFLFALALSFAGCADPDADLVEIADPIAGKADGPAVPLHMWQWQSPTNVFPIDGEFAADGNHDANHCELYLNAIGSGEFSNGGFTTRWLEAYLSVPAQQGELLGVGMIAVTGEADDGVHVLYGEEIEPAYWRTGFTFESTSTPGNNHSIAELAVFADVERPDGRIVRLWQSRQGRNYRLEHAFSLPTVDKPIGGGTIRYSGDGSVVFDQKRACD